MVRPKKLANVKYSQIKMITLFGLDWKINNKKNNF